MFVLWLTEAFESPEEPEVNTGEHLPETDVGSLSKYANAEPILIHEDPENEYVKSWESLSRQLDSLHPEERDACIDRWWNGQKDRFSMQEDLSRLLEVYLLSGMDQPTGLAFKVGARGILESAPSIRIQALDWYGQVDPAEAAMFAKSIFEYSLVPGEWAIALRNYGRQLDEPGKDDIYVSTIRDLLNNADWQANPTRGFLEAFDACVHAANSKLVEDLLHICMHADRRSVQFAAVIALETIAGDDPVMVAEALLCPGSPIPVLDSFRGSLMARLDPNDSRQVDLLRQYLLSGVLSQEEVEAFVGSFPNHNDFAGHHLLTVQQPSGLSQMARTDLAALKAVKNWQGDHAFAGQAEALNKLESRLTAYVNSAVRGGILPPEVME